MDVRLCLAGGAKLCLTRGVEESVITGWGGVVLEAEEVSWELS